MVGIDELVIEHVVMDAAKASLRTVEVAELNRTYRRESPQRDVVKSTLR